MTWFAAVLCMGLHNRECPLLLVVRLGFGGRWRELAEYRLKMLPRRDIFRSAKLRGFGSSLPR